MFVASSVKEIRRIGIFCSQEFHLSRDLLAFFYLRDALSRRLRELRFEFCCLDDRASLQDARRTLYRKNGQDYSSSLLRRLCT